MRLDSSRWYFDDVSKITQWEVGEYSPPAETKDDGGQDTATLEGSTYDDHRCAGCEHELVEGKHDVRNYYRAPRRSSHCLIG
jgi:hypothetical protein